MIVKKIHKNILGRTISAVEKNLKLKLWRTHFICSKLWRCFYNSIVAIVVIIFFILRKKVLFASSLQQLNKITSSTTDIHINIHIYDCRRLQTDNG